MSPSALSRTEHPRDCNSRPRVFPAPQESTSEAVNGYYAVMLLGEVLGNADLRRWGQLLAAVEVTGAQTYWQVCAHAAFGLQHVYTCLPRGTQLTACRRSNAFTRSQAWYLILFS